jgi:hypothetical protein
VFDVDVLGHDDEVPLGLEELKELEPSGGI